jgi:capsular exopolysaccharide synthesis family protein
VIQVTSPEMGDGKTTLAANLAVSIAQSGKSIILIDADFRRPRIHKLFGLSPERGLASVINEPQTEINDVICPSGIPGLSILPCGPIPDNPAELLTQNRFKELLDYIRERYDFVVIDTPPLLKVTDPCVVVRRVDGVLLTIRISKNARPQAQRAKEILATLGANVFGVVVNGVDRSGAYGYGYNYGYHTGYGYQSRYYTYQYTSEDNEDYYSETNGESEGRAGAGPKAGGKSGRRKRQKSRGFFSWLFSR